jgi:hypothetical protein
MIINYNAREMTPEEEKFFKTINEMLSQWAKGKYLPFLPLAYGKLPQDKKKRDKVIEDMLRWLVADMIVQRFPRDAIVYEQPKYSEGTFPPQLRSKVRDAAMELDLKTQFDLLRLPSDELKQYFEGKINANDLRWRAYENDYFPRENTRKGLEVTDVKPFDQSKLEKLNQLLGKAEEVIKNPDRNNQEPLNEGHYVSDDNSPQETKKFINDAQSHEVSSLGQSSPSNIRNLNLIEIIIAWLKKQLEQNNNERNTSFASLEEEKNQREKPSTLTRSRS